jgi:hypothetical protein
MPPAFDRFFADDYFAARRLFLDLSRPLGGRVDAQAIAARGPAGEPLFIDVVELPGQGRAEWSTVIVSSGLHGVEGMFGSAVQCAALDWIGRTDLAARPRLVFAHALNPYGFAWIRRCNEDNVDLNRNFQPNAAGYRGSPEGYARFDRLLNPRSPPRRGEPFRLLGLLAIARYGSPMLRRAIATGQYEYPQGLFYGGQSPCETTRFVAEHFSEWLGSDGGPVLHLDFHTGLGRRGSYQLLSDVSPPKEAMQRAEKTLGRAIHAGMESSSVAYAARGSIGEWCQRQAAKKDYAFLCVEFGTHRPLAMLTALRAENRAHHWDRIGSPTYLWAKRLLKEAFCPSSTRWRERALQQGLDLFQRAMK